MTIEIAKIFPTGIVDPTITDWVDESGRSLADAGIFSIWDALICETPLGTGISLIASGDTHWLENKAPASPKTVTLDLLGSWYNQYQPVIGLLDPDIGLMGKPSVENGFSQPLLPSGVEINLHMGNDASLGDPVDDTVTLLAGNSSSVGGTQMLDPNNKVIAYLESSTLLPISNGVTQQMFTNNLALRVNSFDDWIINHASGVRLRAEIQGNVTTNLTQKMKFGGITFCASGEVPQITPFLEKTYIPSGFNSTTDPWLNQIGALDPLALSIDDDILGLPNAIDADYIENNATPPDGSTTFDVVMSRYNFDTGNASDNTDIPDPPRVFNSETLDPMPVPTGEILLRIRALHPLGSDIVIKGAGASQTQVIEPGLDSVIASLISDQTLALTNVFTDFTIPLEARDYSGAWSLTNESGVRVRVNIDIDTPGQSLDGLRIAAMDLIMSGIPPTPFVPDNDNTTLFVHGLDSLTDTIPLFTLGDATLDTVPLFVHGFDQSSGNIPLHIFGAFLENSSIPLYMRGTANTSASGDIPLFIEGASSIASSGTMNLFLQGQLVDPASGTLELYVKGVTAGVGGGFVTSTLFVEGNNTPSGVMDLFIQGFALPVNDTMPLFLKVIGNADGSIDASDNIPLFVQNAFESGSAGIPLFISGFPAESTNANMPLFIARDSEAISHNLPMFISGPSGVTDNMTLFVQGQLPNSGMSLFIQGLDTPNDTLSLYTHGN